ncbi:2'-5' RNA ligase family protein [Nocardia testacea]|uniref:2'-5' RNA ligase family protein n=1 Tax=Nocardia testacea TaxID=248551 RepID=A0ABW7VSA2_9NOCA
MSPMPTQMRNRWDGRPETPPGHGIIYWHMLMKYHQQVCDTAVEAQKVLDNFSGLHMTPREWLHITTYIAGSTEEIARDQMLTMVSSAQDSLRDVAPISVTVERIFYHPEAISLGVQPSWALLPILDAAQSATRTVMGSEPVSEDPPTPWIPHITVSYSTADQPAGPIISALGTEVPKCEAVIDALTLVIQWGPERRWEWEPVGTAYCAATPGELPGISSDHASS